MLLGNFWHLKGYKRKDYTAIFPDNMIICRKLSMESNRKLIRNNKKVEYFVNIINPQKVIVNETFNSEHINLEVVESYIINEKLCGKDNEIWRIEK